MSAIARAIRPRKAARSTYYNGTLHGSQHGSYSNVMEQGEGVAPQKVAIWSSWDLLCSLGSEMPWDVFRGSGASATQVTKPSYLEDPSGDGYGYNDWAYQVLQSFLSSGNMFGEVLDRDDRGGFPTQVSLWPRSAVDAQLINGTVKWSVQNRPLDDPRQMWHQRAYPVPGLVLGLSPIAHHMVTIGQGLAASRFGLQFFEDGAHPTGILSNSETELSQEQVKAVKARWMAVLSGSREPAVFGKGWAYEQVQISPNESQFLETIRMTEGQCCRIYGPGIAEILGYGDENSQTYTNIVDRRADMLVLAGNKWFNRLERTLTAMLPRGQYARLNRNSLLQATALDRFRAYGMALKDQWMVVNEVRELEDRQPVEWGDKPNATTPAAPAGDGGADPKG